MAARRLGAYIPNLVETNVRDHVWLGCLSSGGNFNKWGTNAQ
jgi:hypothetical protein